MVELVIRTCYKMNPCFFASWNEDKPVLNSQWYSRHCKQDTEICWVTLFCLGLEDGEDEAEISISKIYCLLFCSVLWEYILVANTTSYVIQCALNRRPAIFLYISPQVFLVLCRWWVILVVDLWKRKSKVQLVNCQVGKQGPGATDAASVSSS